MSTTQTATVIFTASFEWWQIVGCDEIQIDGGNWGGDYGVAASAADLDEDDQETWVARVTEVTQRHPKIRVGDYVVCPNGIGGDIVFVRID